MTSTAKKYLIAITKHKKQHYKRITQTKEVYKRNLKIKKEINNGERLRMFSLKLKNDNLDVQEGTR